MLNQDLLFKIQSRIFAPCVSYKKKIEIVTSILNETNPHPGKLANAVKFCAKHNINPDDLIK